MDPGVSGEEDEQARQGRIVMHEYAWKLRAKRWSHWFSLGSLGLGTLLLSVMGATEVFVFEDPIVYLWLLSGGLMLLLAVGIYQLINWRCPQCQSQFHAQRNPRFCSNCGVRLRE